MPIAKHSTWNAAAVTGQGGTRILHTVAETGDAIDWVVIDCPAPLLLTSHLVENLNAAAESIAVTVVRSRLSLAQLGGDIDTTDARVEVVTDGEAVLADAVLSGQDDEAHHALIAVGVASSVSGTDSVEVRITLGASA